MGIRFLCQNCDQKVHVKSFLAGKRGICPHCGGRVYIPAENQLPSSKKAKSVAQAVGSNGKDHSYDAGESVVITAEEVSDSADSAESIPSAVVVPTAEAVPAAPSVRDPIDEAPSGAVWYVRPPSGGQFGPAEGEVMRRWLSEGRVSSDSLIWREGWDDWRMADVLFPSLSGAPTPPAAPTTSAPVPPAASGASIPATPTGSPSSATARIRARRQSSKGMGIAIITVLGILIVALAVVLIVVVGNK